jgi:hypothetical protein
MLKKLNKNILSNNLKSQRGLISLTRKFKFLRTERPWLMNQDVDELPAKDSEFDFRLDSKRTYTKWFNPMTFDPRTPDYYETVRSEWQEDVTREDFGQSNFILYITNNSCP